MDMLWSDSLLTGVRKIDEQHRELIRRVENVLDAGKQGRGAQEVAQMLEFLNAYVVEHFRDEERLQMESRYPDYVMHKKLHSEFVLRVRELIGSFAEKGPTLDMMITTNKVVVDWLINHINAMDKAFAQFYKQKMVEKG